MENTNTALFTFKNGVQKMDTILVNDFKESQRIFDISYILDNFESEYVYTDRIYFEGVGTYKVKIARYEDFSIFRRKLDDEKYKLEMVYRQKRKKLRYYFYERGLVNEDELVTLSERTFDECNEHRLMNLYISFEEWKTGKTSEGRKLGKVMRKAGASQELLDFYSLQTKDEKDVYITISDCVQHIAGMSYYSNLNWDGYNDSSCQDVRWDYEGNEKNEGVIQLAGSLHDNKLFIGFLHESLEDLEDMDDKMIARTILRYVIVDNKPALIATKYYGNNDTKDMLGLALKQLYVIDVYDNDIRIDGNYIKEVANGAFTHTTFNDIHVCYTEESEVTCTCPTCYGDGNMEYEGHDITCQTCYGSGEVETMFYHEVDEWIEVEEELEILPYSEGYSHYTDCIKIRVNEDEVIRLRNKAKSENKGE